MKNILQSITITVIKAIGSMTNSLRVAIKKMMHDIDLRCEMFVTVFKSNEILVAILMRKSYFLFRYSYY